MVLDQKPNLIFTVGMISGVSEGRHSLSIWIWIWNAIFRPVVDYLCQIFQLGLICSCWPPPSHQKFWSAVVNLIRVSWAVKYHKSSVGACSVMTPSWGTWARCPSSEEPQSSRSRPCGPQPFGPKRDLLFRRRSSYVIAHGTSVCLSSVVCDVAPYSEGWTFRQYFAPSNSIRTRAVCIKILEKKLKVFSSGVEDWAVFNSPHGKALNVS